jgi:peptidoglycan hydrolase-like protein with peptidoglycan-binding domain
MRQSVWRWLYGAGAVAAVGTVACGQGLASAAPAAPARIAITSQQPLTPASGPYRPPSKALYVGEHGAAVRNVQRRLAALHYYPGPIDGVFGLDLQQAAWAFREVQGMRLNATTAAQPISRNFELALEHPKAPKALKPGGGSSRVEINLAIQVLVLYKNNQPSLILHISPGGGYHYCNPGPPKGDGSCGRAVTQDGNFHAEYMISGWDKVPLGYMYNPVFFNAAAGQAVHGGDPDPWYAASHGCVRLPGDVQDWFWKQLSIGGKHPTPFYVRGTAPYQPQIVGA